MQVVDRRGRIVARSGALGGRVLPAGPATRAALDGRRHALRRRAARRRADPRSTPRRSASSAAARRPAAPCRRRHDGRHRAQTLSRARRLVLLCALAAAALAALLATLLTRRALRPLRRLSSGARAIERPATPPSACRCPHARRGRRAVRRRSTRCSPRSSARARPSGASSPTPRTSCAHRSPRCAATPPTWPVTAPTRPCWPTSRPTPRGSRPCSTTCSRLPARTPPAPGTWRAGRPARALARSVAAADANTEVVIEPGAEATTVRGEPLALERAVGNLVRNAREHGPAGGPDHRDGRAQRGADRARITVDRRGPGPQPTTTPSTPSSASGAARRRRGEGSGLGLAIVARDRRAPRRVGRRRAGRASRSSFRSLRDLSRSRPYNSVITAAR